MEKSITTFKCISCKSEFPADPFRYQCSACGNNLDVIFNYDLIRSNWSIEELMQNTDRSIWRYLPLLPVQSKPEMRSIQVGGTPLVSLQKLADKFKIGRLFIKDDTRNVSGSLKDRASEVGIQHAHELGYETLIAASTGNAAASLAALCAYHQKKAVILTPVSAPLAKLTQILQYGATLIPIDGSYDQAFDLSQKAAKYFDWYSRSTGVNSILSEGKKTVALEIAEQLNWQVPDKIFVPVGDGCIIGGVYKGFYDLKKLGWIESIPKIIAVQAEGSAAIVNALNSKSEIKSVNSNTIADSIAVDLPRDGEKALRAIHNSNGFGLIVSDEKILSAQKELSASTGIFAEPAAATAFAGFNQAVMEDKIHSGESVVVLITGTGLKDIPAAQKRIRLPKAITPELEILEMVVNNSVR